MCRSHQTNDVTEHNSSSGEECSLIQSSNSGDEFEIKSIETAYMPVEQIEDYIENRLEAKEYLETDQRESQKIKKKMIHGGIPSRNR